MASYDDPDNGEDPNSPGALTPVWTYQWFVPKVSRPVLENDDHWQNAAGNQRRRMATFTPDADDVDKFLRVRITYTDAKGEDKLFVMSDFPVRARMPATGNVAPAVSTRTATSARET